MLDLLVFLPLAGRRRAGRRRGCRTGAARAVLVAVTGVELLLALGLWLAYDPRAGVTGGFAYERRLQWIPTVDSGYHVGVDGLSLPLVLLTAGLFFCCALYAWREQRRPRTFAALLLFLQTACLGVFASLDLILFFVFFDLSIVGMYFLIAGWGHGAATRSALKFFLYTFLGSLALLVGFLALFAGSAPHTFDMVALAQDPPLQGRPVAGGLALLAIGVGLAVKTPTVPFHTWLPPAHTDAPAVGSALLAGVLLKMGTYGFVRIALPMLPEAWRTWAVVAVVVGAVGVLYGALVALAQTDLKRMIAYTSVAHMGYVLLAVGAAGVVGGTTRRRAPSRSPARSPRWSATGFITGALFLLAGRAATTATGRTTTWTPTAGCAAAPRASPALFAVARVRQPRAARVLRLRRRVPGARRLAAAPRRSRWSSRCSACWSPPALFLWAISRLLLGAAGPAAPDEVDRPARRASSPASRRCCCSSLLLGVLPRPLLDVVEPSARGGRGARRPVNEDPLRAAARARPAARRDGRAAARQLPAPAAAVGRPAGHRRGCCSARPPPPRVALAGADRQRLRRHLRRRRRSPAPRRLVGGAGRAAGARRSWPRSVRGDPRESEQYVLLLLGGARRVGARGRRTTCSCWRSPTCWPASRCTRWPAPHATAAAPRPRSRPTCSAPSSASPCCSASRCCPGVAGGTGYGAAARRARRRAAAGRGGRAGGAARRSGVQGRLRARALLGARRRRRAPAPAPPRCSPRSPRSAGCSRPTGCWRPCRATSWTGRCWSARARRAHHDAGQPRRVRPGRRPAAARLVDRQPGRLPADGGRRRRPQRPGAAVAGAVPGGVRGHQPRRLRGRARRCRGATRLDALPRAGPRTGRRSRCRCWSCCSDWSAPRPPPSSSASSRSSPRRWTAGWAGWSSSRRSTPWRACSTTCAGSAPVFSRPAEQVPEPAPAAEPARIAAWSAVAAAACSVLLGLAGGAVLALAR